MCWGGFRRCCGYDAPLHQGFPCNATIGDDRGPAMAWVIGYVDDVGEPTNQSTMSTRPSSQYVLLTRPPSTTDPASLYYWPGPVGLVFVQRAKRRKACDSCTLRKIRCDGVQPSCGPCAARLAQCGYSTRLRSGPKVRPKYTHVDTVVVVVSSGGVVPVFQSSKPF